MYFQICPSRYRRDALPASAALAFCVRGGGGQFGQWIKLPRYGPFSRAHRNLSAETQMTGADVTNASMWGQVSAFPLYFPE